MCVPGCSETVMQRLGRRNLLKGSALAAAGATMTVMAPAPAPAATERSFSRVVDLTHVLGPSFPTFGGAPGIEFERIARFDSDGYNMLRWLLVEHTGTHMDAPIHFSADGHSAEQIPAEQLVVPLAVVDIAARAEDDPDTELTPDDLSAWEAAHGPIPQGGCVAMHSGWDRKVGGDGFRNVDADGGLHFPGFHEEAVAYLLENTTAAGIAVDTLSLDHGPSQTFSTHYKWLPENRWGMECVANLGDLPATGATMVVGSPAIEGATGGPSRILALV